MPAGYSSTDGERMADAFGTLLKRHQASPPAFTLRVGVENRGRDQPGIMRAHSL